MSEDFVNVFIQFVEDGGYEHIDKGTGENQFFRFSKPKDNAFPHMIELFSKRPDYLNSFVTRLGPIHISDDGAFCVDNEPSGLIRACTKISPFGEYPSWST